MTDRIEKLIELKLAPTADGTQLTITESGFDALPDDKRREDALRNNDRGWTEQVDHITAHVES